MALAWSKNPPGGLQRTDFTASMAVAVTHKPAKRGHWLGVENGYYVIPLEYLRDTVTLTSNNKTDSLIAKLFVLAGLRHAAEKGLFIPLDYNHGWGVKKFISTWRMGLKAVTEAS